MDNGWATSADAWIEEMGEHGDFTRRYVLDRVMLSRALAPELRNVLDVGCGEGRFCRMLKQHGKEPAGIDLTPALIAAARRRDPEGAYIQADAERLPFRDENFDLVVSYLTLIDIPDLRAAIFEMARVLKRGGTLLIANLNSFTTACADTGWVRNTAGERLHYPVDNYLEERALWLQYRGIRVINFHRPMSAYMRALLDAGLRLVYFDEPEPGPDAPSDIVAHYRRVPWFLVMEWAKPSHSRAQA